MRRFTLAALLILAISMVATVASAGVYSDPGIIDGPTISQQYSYN